MTNLQVKTDPKLLDSLARAAKRRLTPEEIEAQRLSIIFSGINPESGMTKIRIKEILDAAQGR